MLLNTDTYFSLLRPKLGPGIITGFIIQGSWSFIIFCTEQLSKLQESKSLPSLAFKTYFFQANYASMKLQRRKKRSLDASHLVQLGQLPEEVPICICSFLRSLLSLYNHMKQQNDRRAKTQLDTEENIDKIL